MNLIRSPKKRDYFIGQRGWLDLLGSIPSLGIFRLTVLLRLARLSRLARIGRLLGGSNKKALVKDILDNRGSYAAFITILSAFTVLVASSVLVLQFESRSPDANIHTGGDALWWAVVTITTVGYGDQYPVTLLGRLTGVAVMAAGIGIIGALASILASVLVPQPDKPEPVDPAVLTVEQELALIRAELAGFAGRPRGERARPDRLTYGLQNPISPSSETGGSPSGKKMSTRVVPSGWASGTRSDELSGAHRR